MHATIKLRFSVFAIIVLFIIDWIHLHGNNALEKGDQRYLLRNTNYKDIYSLHVFPGTKCLLPWRKDRVMDKKLQKVIAYVYCD